MYQDSWGRATDDDGYQLAADTGIDEEESSFFSYGESAAGPVYGSVSSLLMAPSSEALPSFSREKQSETNEDVGRSSGNNNTQDQTQVDWQHLYASALTDYGQRPSVATAEALVTLVERFTKAAQEIASEVILDRRKPASERMFHPIDAGGVAGGVKYLLRNLFLKVSVDHTGMYGGNQIAGKAASLEILATNHLLDALGQYSPDTKLHFPLCCVVFFGGVAVLVSSCLPIGSDSLRYGSADGGKTVFASDLQLNSLIQQLAEACNLKKHQCAKTDIFLAADVEGHVGTDGHFYLLDTARTFPCESPLLPSMGPKRRNGHLFKLLRPELVKRWRTPLCSDSFSGFIRADPQAKTHNREVHEATIHLRSVIIPFFFERLRKRKQLASDPLLLRRDLHLFGINIRHLGQLAKMALDAREDELHSCLLGEMVARCLKNLAREKWASLDADGSNLQSDIDQLIAFVTAEVSAEVVVQYLLRDFDFMADPGSVGHQISMQRSRAIQLLGINPAHERVDAVVKHLFSFSFYTAYRLIEERFKSIEIADARKAVQFYRKTLETLASEHLLQNYAVSCVELVRKLVGAQVTHSRQETDALLESAEEAFATVCEVKTLYGTDTGEDFAEMLVSWSAAARFKENWDLMERRIRRAWSISGIKMSTRTNGIFLLARKGLDEKNISLLHEMRDDLVKLVDEDKVGAVAIYDCGVICWWCGDDRAATYFEMATLHEETRNGALYMLAILAYQMEDWDQTVARSTACLEADPTFFKASIMMAKGLMKQAADQPPEQQLETLKGVIGYLEKVLATSSFGGEVYALMAMTFKSIWGLSRHLGMLEHAVRYFRLATQEGYESVDLLLNGALSAFLLALLGLEGRFLCDLCEGSIGPLRYHCPECGDFDACEPCCCRDGHQHALVEMETGEEELALLQEAYDWTISGLNLATGSSSSPEVRLVDFIGRGNVYAAGCVTQAKDILSRLALFPIWARRLYHEVCQVWIGTTVEWGRFELAFLRACATSAPDLRADMRLSFLEKLKRIEEAVDIVALIENSQS